MSDKPTGNSKGGRTFAEQVGAKATRKLKARSNPSPVWFGLGMMGVIGWSVVIPTLLGAGVGLDGDGDDPGEAAARDCALRWMRQGRRVRIARPPRGMDFNDVLLGRAPVIEEGAQ